MWLLAASSLVTQYAVAAAWPQDEGPVLKPKPKTQQPAGATLLVMCDLACNWKLDGEVKGRIEAGAAAKVKVELGQHILVAITEDGADQVKQLSEVKNTGQTVVSLELQPVRDARLAAKEVTRAREQQQNQAKELYEQKQYVEAKPLFEMACKNGELESCVYLGVLYENGIGADVDLPQAHLLYKKACDGGDMAGCNNLATLFEYGKGEVQNYAQARLLYEKACNQGNLSSCDNLGWFYQNGFGMPRDPQRARSLYQKACNGNIQIACDHLDRLP
jgi:hypothetical protein